MNYKKLPLTLVLTFTFSVNAQTLLHKGNQDLIFLSNFEDVFATTLFQEDFNALPEQLISGKCTREGYPGSNPGDCDNVPENWDFTYTSQRNSINPVAEIINEAGMTGRGFSVYDESYGDNNSWGHDIQLAKHFAPTQYSELWASLWIRFNPDLDTSDLGSAKIFRMGHYNPRVIDGTTQTPVVSTNRVTSEGPTTSGLMFYDIKRVNSTHYRHLIALRGDPKYKFSFATKSTQFEIKDENGEIVDKSWPATFGDGQWHHFEFGMIMNSAPDVEDGQAIVYLDDIYQGGRDDMPYLQSNHDPDASGFNMFTIGGNADSVWDGQSNAEQHFYDIDNVKICTTRCLE